MSDAPQDRDECRICGSAGPRIQNGPDAGKWINGCCVPCDEMVCKAYDPPGVTLETAEEIVRGFGQSTDE